MAGKQKKSTNTKKAPRAIRPYEERLAEYDRKIKFHEDSIAAVKAKKEKMQNPPMSREDKKTVITAAAQSGFSAEEITEILAKAKAAKD